MEAKRCRKCGVVKPLDDYNRNKNTRDGLQYHCRECTNETSRVWREENPERSREASRAWAENNRERSRANARAWARANPERRRENNRAWRGVNKERQRGNMRAWQQANPEKCHAAQHRRRARKACAVPQRWTVDHTLGDPLACWWCGRGLLGATAHVDHVMPIRLGGPAETANEVMSCADCNHSKNAKHPLVWIAELVS